jgi:hypothetical protein
VAAFGHSDELLDMLYFDGRNRFILPIASIDTTSHACQPVIGCDGTELLRRNTLLEEILLLQRTLARIMQVRLLGKADTSQVQ